MAYDLEACLPQSAKDRSVTSGVEYALLFEDAVTAISCADGRQIAVLGVESFRAQPDGLLVMNYSGYDLSFDGEDWPSYVKANNVHARQFLEEQVDKERLHFILTATSQREYESLRDR